MSNDMMKLTASCLVSASVATSWGWNLVGIKEWFGLRKAASDVQLWECTIFLWMTKPIYSFSCPSTAVVRRERRFCAIAIFVVAGSHMLT
jgi:hypothetical protein